VRILKLPKETQGSECKTDSLALGATTLWSEFWLKKKEGWVRKKKSLWGNLGKQFPEAEEG